MSNHFLNHNSRKESGAVLITGLIFLVVLTMVVLSVLRSGTLEERMAANSRNRQVAMQAAEAVMRDAQEQLFSGAEVKSRFDSGNAIAVLANGFYRAPVAGSAPRWQTIDWGSSTQTLTFASSGSDLYGVASAPRYMVEIITPPSRPNSAVPCSKGLATITARGVGKDSSTVFVQTMYRYVSDRPSDGC
jgi:type IV pilus assembly protein PilX